MKNFGQFQFGDDLTTLFDYLQIIEIRMAREYLEKQTPVPGTEPLFEAALKTLRDAERAQRSAMDLYAKATQQRTARRASERN